MSVLFTSTRSFIVKVYDASVSKDGLLFEIAVLHDYCEEAAMNPNDAKEKLARYYREAEVARLMKDVWRKRWAKFFHYVADRLEPPAKVGRQEYLG
jgi:hypothetical protein